MASKYGGSSREPTPSAGNFSSTEKSKRPVLFGALATTVVTSAGLALTNIGTWAASGTWGGVAMSGVTGLLAGAANHLTTSIAESRQKKKDAQASAGDSGSSGSTASGASASVGEVINAANAGIRKIREDALSALVGIETRLQMAAALAAELATGTGHTAPASVKSHIDRVQAKVAEIRGASGSAVERAEGWVKGL